LLILERYLLQKLIGRGGFYQTFLALDQDQFPPIPCIVQQFQHRHSQIPQPTIALIFAQLDDYRQIPTHITCFTENQSFYWVQEFIQGPSLDILLAEQGVLTETQIWQLLQKLLPVLQFIHDRQIIHCNIQPKNIILRLGLEWDLVLVNFALAQIANQVNYPRDEFTRGSPEYTAPERIQGQAVFSSDLYSLGVTCIYLLTQIPPFDLFDVGENKWVWREYLTNPVSDRLSQILDQLLQNQVKDRFLSAAAAIQAMGMKNTSRKPTSQNLNSPWRCLSTLTSLMPKLGSVNALAFSPSQPGTGERLASGSDRQITIWDLDTLQIIANFQGHIQAVKSVAFSPDHKVLATASDDKTIKLWDLAGFQEISTLVGHSQAVKSVVFSPDGQILASGSWDKTIKLWDAHNWRLLATLTGHRLQISAIAFHPQEKLLASASHDRQIYLWREESQNRSCYTLSGILSGHAWAVLAVAFSPNGKLLATGGDDNQVKLWDVNTGQPIRTFLGHSWSVVAVAFTTDSETLISASWDQTIKLWRVDTGEEITTLSGHTNSVSTVAVSPAKQLIASGSRDKTIKLWELVLPG
jgi:serine/threonine protein kinase